MYKHFVDFLKVKPSHLYLYSALQMASMQLHSK